MRPIYSKISCRMCGNPLKESTVSKGQKDCYKCYTEKEAKRGHYCGAFGKPRQKRIAKGLPVKTYK